MSKLEGLAFRLVRAGYDVMQSRRLVRLFQDKGLIMVAVNALSVPAWSLGLMRTGGESVAGLLGLATHRDLLVLEQQIAMLEKQRLAATESSRPAPSVDLQSGVDCRHDHPLSYRDSQVEGR